MFTALKKTPRDLPMTGELVPGILPSKGLNLRDMYDGMPPADAIALINARPTARGVSMRYGYRTYAENLPGAGKVQALMSFFPASATSYPAALFDGYLLAATNGHIYDVTSGGAGAWTSLLAAAATSDFWSWLNFQNAGGNFLTLCNEAGGYYYMAATDLAAIVKVTQGGGAGQISGADPDTFAHHTVWKRRQWFIAKNSTKAYYLPVDQLTGAVALWDFGPQFRHGGTLVALENWTIDGGEGIDDYLVAVSSEGDVVIYKGYDPDTAGTDPAAFALHGIWYVGSLPAGRRSVKSIGGDVHILTTQGLVQASKLVALANLERNSSTNISAKVDPLIELAMKTRAGVEDWYVADIPSDNSLVLGLPETVAGQGVRQLVFDTQRLAWCLYQDVPVACMLDHDHVAFGGSHEDSPDGGKVFLLFDDYFDARSRAGTDGVGILSRVTPAYGIFDSPGIYKSASMVRLTLVYTYTPELAISILGDFITRTTASVASLVATAGSRWNAAYWGVGRWFGEATPVRKWTGTIGGGYSLAAQIDLQGAGGTELVSLDWMIQKGGGL